MKFFWMMIFSLFSSTAIGETKLPPCDEQLPPVRWDKCVGSFSPRAPDGVDVGTYEGEWRNGKWTGRGSVMFPSGNFYVGEFKDFKYDGQGTLVQDGAKYTGEWKEDKPHGEGRYSYADGREYVGSFEYGKWHGWGKLSFKDGSSREGRWENGKLVFERGGAQTPSDRSSAASNNRERCLSEGVGLVVCAEWVGSRMNFVCEVTIWDLIGEAPVPRWCWQTDSSNFYGDLEVRNNFLTPVKDVTFNCQQIARSGTVLRTDSRIIYDVWDTKETKKVQLKLPKHEQTVRISCSASPRK